MLKRRKLLGCRLKLTRRLKQTVSLLKYKRKLIVWLPKHKPRLIALLLRLTGLLQRPKRLRKLRLWLRKSDWLKRHALQKKPVLLKRIDWLKRLQH